MVERLWRRLRPVLRRLNRRPRLLSRRLLPLNRRLVRHWSLVLNGRLMRNSRLAPVFRHMLFGLPFPFLGK